MELRVTGLRVHFGTVEALAGVDLSFPPGEVAVLAGPNGSGKSTLMGVILGLVRPDGGSLHVDGEDLLASSRRRRRAFREHIGYLPESVAFGGNLTGRQVMRFFARARGVPTDRAEQVLSWVGLGGPAGRAVRGYSRGMRQRLGLGVAVLSEPRLLVLDEPTGGLDHEGISLLWEVLEQWKAAGRTVLLSTHDLTLIERRCDAIHLLSAGRLVASGGPDELRRLTKLPVRIRMALDDASEAELLAGVLSEHFGVPVDLGDGELGLSVPPAELLRVVRTVEQQQSALTDLRVEEPGLDAVYQHLLERR